MTRRILVTGAGGFVGARLASHLLKNSVPGTRLTFTDLRLRADRDARAKWIEGDFTDASVRADMIGEGVDVLFHLAGVLGGAAERDPGLARKINLDGTLDLLEAVAQRGGPPPRVVFASSIAVFGAPLPAILGDDTPPFPTMLYGAQKRMIEIVIEQMTASGRIDGYSLRLPGIVARPDADTRLKSAFLSHLFQACRSHDAVVVPVSPQGTTWLISANACVDALEHASRLPEDLSPRSRTVTLPALRVEMDALVRHLTTLNPGLAHRVTFEPDQELTRQFASYPPLETSLAESLGFVHDGSLEALAANGLRALEPEAAAVPAT